MAKRGQQVEEMDQLEALGTAQPEEGSMDW